MVFSCLFVLFVSFACFFIVFCCVCSFFGLFVCADSPFAGVAGMKAFNKEDNILGTAQAQRWFTGRMMTCLRVYAAALRLVGCSALSLTLSLSLSLPFYTSIYIYMYIHICIHDLEKFCGLKDNVFDSSSGQTSPEPAARAR